MGKMFKGFRFEPTLYESFKKMAPASGLTVTGAFERFMTLCVESGMLVFPERGVEGIESEARVLADWLAKGKRFYYGERNEELSVDGRLLWLLPKVRDAALRDTVESVLKGAISDKK